MRFSLTNALTNWIAGRGNKSGIYWVQLAVNHLPQHCQLFPSLISQRHSSVCVCRCVGGWALRCAPFNPNERKAPIEFKWGEVEGENSGVRRWITGGKIKSDDRLEYAHDRLIEWTNWLPLPTYRLAWLTLWMSFPTCRLGEWCWRQGGKEGGGQGGRLHNITTPSDRTWLQAALILHRCAPICNRNIKWREMK